MKNSNRILALTLALALLCAGCSAPASPASQTFPVSAAAVDETPETVVFTDSAGREVTVPAKIDKLAVTGPLAQITVFALAPERFAGVASMWSKQAEGFIPAEYAELPELGQFYGGGEFSLETLLSSGAQVVIDVGNTKKNTVEDMDALTEQTGVPFVHIAAELGEMDKTYEKLGELLGVPDEAKKLSDYCAQTYSMIKTLSQSVEKKRVLYVLGENGLNVLAKDSFHGEVVDMLSQNAAEVDEPSSRGTGNETDMEQILSWDPEVVLFAPESVYDAAASDPAWSQLTAIQNGEYYKVPFGPYNWMGFPPSAQRFLGMLWMAKLLYPEAAQYDLYEKAAEYFSLFYHTELTRAQFDALTADSTGVQAERAAAR